MDRAWLKIVLGRLSDAGLPRDPQAKQVEPEPELDVKAEREVLFRLAARTGVHSRDVKEWMPPHLKEGSSSSNYSAWFKQESLERREELHARRFDNPGDPPIVAVLIDGTRFKKSGKQKEAREIRNGVEKQEPTWAVTIAIGVRADGTRVALGARVTPGEGHEPVGELLEDIVDRGVDRRVLFIADQGEGIRLAVQKLAHPGEPNLQLCVVHAAGVVKDKLKAVMPPEEVKAVNRELYRAWDQDDPDVALEMLEQQEDKLRQAGHVDAANSINRFKEGTLTVYRLGLMGELRRQLRSTNSQEGANAAVKHAGAMPEVTRFEDEEMLERWVSWHLLEIEKGWNRFADPEQLVEMGEELSIGSENGEEIRTRLPPTMSVAPYAVSFEHDEQMLATATSWCAEHPGASWIGSSNPKAADTLKALGLDAKDQVTPEALLGAMRCRGPKGEILRGGRQVSFRVENADGIQVEALVTGVSDLRWELKAPRALTRKWQQGGKQAEEAEAWLLAAAPEALEAVTLTTTPHHGFAGVMALQRPSAEEPDRPLSVVGFCFGKQQGKGAKFQSPASENTLRSATRRIAEDAAEAVLQEKHLAAGGEASLEEFEPSPELLADISARALELGPEMVAMGQKELEILDAGRDEAFHGLNQGSAEINLWWDRDWQAAAGQIAAETLRANGRPAHLENLGPWWPLTLGQRRVLGEARSLQLHGAAASLRGVAEADPDAASKIKGSREDVLSGLRDPIASFDAAAKTVAAGQELKRREQQKALEEGDLSVAQPEASDRPRRAPIDRFGPVLERDRADAIKRYAEALAPQLRGKKTAALQRLAAASEKAWTELVDVEGVKLAGVERRRDAALGEWQKELWRFGVAAGSEARARINRNGDAFNAALDEAADARSKSGGHRRQLQALKAELADQLLAAGSPGRLFTGDLDTAINPAALAALNQAVHVELGRPERLREVGASVGRGGGEAPQLNRVVMTGDLMPTFTATPVSVVPDEREAVQDLPSVGGDDWFWIGKEGEEGVLSQFGLRAGAEVNKGAFVRVARGFHATKRMLGQDGEEQQVRKSRTIKLLQDGKPTSQSATGLVQMKGEYIASATTLERWAMATPEAREEIRKEVIAETQAGIAHVAETDDIAAAVKFSVVGEGAELKVEWAGLGADRGNGLKCLYDRSKKRKEVENLGPSATEFLHKRATERAQAAEEAKEAPPATKEEAPAARSPQAEPAAANPAERTTAAPETPRGLPSKPLRDRLTANVQKLGRETALEIKSRADDTRTRLEGLTDEQLWARLQTHNPIEKVGPNPGPLSSWDPELANGVVHDVAIEQQLLANAKGFLSDLAKSRAKAGDKRADLLPTVSAMRREEAWLFEDRAAWHASRMWQMPEDKRAEVITTLDREIAADGIKEAGFETLAKRIGVQHVENYNNERAAQIESTVENERDKDPAGISPDFF